MEHWNSALRSENNPVGLHIVEGQTAFMLNLMLCNHQPLLTVLLHQGMVPSIVKTLQWFSDCSAVKSQAAYPSFMCVTLLMKTTKVVDAERWLAQALDAGCLDVILRLGPLIESLEKDDQTAYQIFLGHGEIAPFKSNDAALLRTFTHADIKNHIGHLADIFQERFTGSCPSELAVHVSYVKVPVEVTLMKICDFHAHDLAQWKEVIEAVTRSQGTKMSVRIDIQRGSVEGHFLHLIDVPAEIRMACQWSTTACAIGVAIFQPSSSAPSTVPSPSTSGYHWALVTHSNPVTGWKNSAVNVYQIIIAASTPNGLQWEESHLTTPLASLATLLGIIQLVPFKSAVEDDGLGQADLDAYIRELGPEQNGYNTRGRGWGPLAYVLRIVESLREAELLPLPSSTKGKGRGDEGLTIEEMIMEGEALGAKLEHLREEGVQGVPVVNIGK
ncbi:hypothetical protein HWV62_40828 [Athelia sp. TMB]|nr:hypothetical protein HWV62_40828 [Athelia sp. TMB]